MTADPLSFTASIDLHDGRKVFVSIEIPADHPSGLQWKHVGESGEIAHMAANHALNQMLRGDKSRERDRDEEIAFMNAEIVDNLNKKAPF